MMNKNEWEQLRVLAEMMLRVADNEGWSKTDIARLLAELALKAYSMGVREWTPPTK